MSAEAHLGQAEPFRWKGLPLLSYKEEAGTHFKSVTRQVLFGGEASGSELRYFEVAPGGHTTLERHAHPHRVVVIRGSGRALVGNRVHDLATHDLVEVPPSTWHQFRAGEGEPLGFLCLVPAERDRPERPGPAELAAIRKDPPAASFIRV
ncbi:MAG TPA: cupin domain-containing protein [Opitutaceae bacterium]